MGQYLTKSSYHGNTFLFLDLKFVGLNSCLDPGAVSWCDLILTIDLGSARMFSDGTLDTYFSYQKAIWIVAIDFYISFYLIVLPPVTVILQLRNRSVNMFYSFIIN